MPLNSQLRIILLSVLLSLLSIPEGVSIKVFTYCLEVQESHDLFTQLATQLPQFGDGQILQEPRDGARRHHSLLTWLVHP